MASEPRFWRSPACSIRLFRVADGSLARSQFAYYVGQDAFFLEAFARAYCVAAAKAPDWEGFTTFHTLAAGVLDELHLHQAYAASWQVDLPAVPGAATRRYTDFLLATAWGCEVGLTTVAMVPACAYMPFWAKSWLKGAWPTIPMLAGFALTAIQCLRGLAQQLERLGDRHTTLTSQARSTYRYAMQCEQDFFQAALGSGSETISSPLNVE